MENIKKCEYYDAELDCCKYFSDWSDAMPVLQPCVESHYENTDQEKLEKNVLFANMIFQCVNVCLAVVLILTVQKDERLS